MPSAFYYPHTTIRDPRILKSALLLWDKVECITPGFGKRPHSFDDDRLNAATALVVQDHVPTEAERAEVHDAIADLLKKGIPDWLELFPDAVPNGTRPYPIYAGKLSERTWQLLQDESLSYWRDDGDGVVAESLGLLIMSLLADACAGTQKQRVTDRGEAYSSLTNFLGAAAGGAPLTAFDETHAGEQLDALVSVSFRILDAEDLPLQSLIALREREAAESGTDLKSFRVRYAAKVKETLDKLIRESRGDSDREAIFDAFEFEMRDDFHSLKSELGLAKSKAIKYKDVIVTAGVLLTAAASLVAGHPVLGTVIGATSPASLGTMLDAKKEYAAARNRALRNHATSWLYLASKPSHRIITRA